MATTMSRLQIAERMHRLLLREIDYAIDIDRLLADARYARDVLLVCDAVPGGELLPLAALFREASRQAPAAARQAGGGAPRPAGRSAAAAPPAPDPAPSRADRHADSDWVSTLSGPARPAASPARRAGDSLPGASGFDHSQPPADPTVPDVHQAEPQDDTAAGPRPERRRNWPARWRDGR